MDTLKHGDHGEQVRRLQRALIAAGYDCGNIDGVFGAVTESAVRFFQADHDLIPNGVAAEETWRALIAEENTEKQWREAGITLNERVTALEKQVDTLTARLAALEVVIK